MRIFLSIKKLYGNLLAVLETGKNFLYVRLVEILVFLCRCVFLFFIAIPINFKFIVAYAWGRGIVELKDHENNDAQSKECGRASSYVEMLEKAILDNSLEAWRFSGVFKRITAKLEEKDQRRYQSQFKWFLDQVSQSLDIAGFKTVDLTGMDYDVGMPVSVRNDDEMDESKHLIIAKMIEPIVMRDGKIVKTGTVMVKEASV